MNAAAEAIAHLVGSGWVSAAAHRPRDEAIPRPLAGAPDGLVDWVSAFASLSAPDDAVWFLSLADYDDQTDDAFAWNAFETLSLEAAATECEAARVREFWSAHVPILLGVRGHYAYLAVRADGAVVHGEEPEFEESTVVAESLAGFLASLGDESRDRHELVTRLVFGP